MKIAVLDTNVIQTALRSSTGASAAVIQLLAEGAFILPISAAVVLEYEEVLLRDLESVSDASVAQGGKAYTAADMRAVVDYLCKVGVETRVDRMGPFLKPKAADDEKFVELAATAVADYLLTYNLRDFKGAETVYNGKVCEPKDALPALRKGKKR